MVAYLALQVADEQTLKDLARLVAVADILEGFCSVLAADVEEHFLTTAVCTLSAFVACQFGFRSAKSLMPYIKLLHVIREEGRRKGHASVALSDGCMLIRDGWHVRVLVDEAGRVVDLIVDDDVEILLGGVFRDVGVGEFLSGGHCVECGGCAFRGGVQEGERRGIEVSRRVQVGGVRRGGCGSREKRRGSKLFDG